MSKCECFKLATRTKFTGHWTCNWQTTVFCCCILHKIKFRMADSFFCMATLNNFKTWLNLSEWSRKKKRLTTRKKKSDDSLKTTTKYKCSSRWTQKGRLQPPCEHHSSKEVSTNQWWVPDLLPALAMKNVIVVFNNQYNVLYLNRKKR